MSKKHSHKYFRNTDCEYFPCHETEDPSHFNCLFCFCPLYFMKDCGGNPEYTRSGIKDCSHCIKPHAEGGYDHVMRRLRAEFKRSREPSE